MPKRGCPCALLWQGGTDEQGKERKAAAVDAGALSVLVNAMRFHEKDPGVMQWGARALSNITFGSNEWRTLAKESGARCAAAAPKQRAERERDPATCSVAPCAAAPPPPTPPS